MNRRIGIFGLVFLLGERTRRFVSPAESLRVYNRLFALYRALSHAERAHAAATCLGISRWGIGEPDELKLSTTKAVKNMAKYSFFSMWRR